MTSIAQQLETLARRLDAVLPVDRAYARREIRRIRKAAQGNDNSPQLLGRCERLAQRLAASESVRRARLDHRPVLAFDPNLPISAKREELIEAIRKHRVMIVAGETGSGKTTQLPKFCLAAGRGIDGWIGLTQPRRIAATTVSRRIAEELNEEIGQSVGYKIRFQDKVGPRTRIKVMTDGILLAEAHGDGYLNAYDTVIIDEAHERSLNIDFILGIVKQLLAKRRDLKVIITRSEKEGTKDIEVYDLKNDPKEKIDRILDHGKVIRDFVKMIIAYYREKKKIVRNLDLIKMDENQKEKLRALGYIH